MLLNVLQLLLGENYIDLPLWLLLLLLLRTFLFLIKDVIPIVIVKLEMVFDLFLALASHRLSHEIIILIAGHL